MTDDDIKRLRELAQAATAGPWDVRVAYEAERGVIDPMAYISPGYYDNLGVYSPAGDAWPVGCDEYDIFHSPEDAAYIAAASPDRVLALLDRLAAAERERDALLNDWNAIVAASGSRTHGGAVGHVAAMVRERDALAADAARYRWLRDEHIGDDPESINLPVSKRPGLDAAIDAALAAGETKHG
jgi:hypothetical protein